ncbi:MAG: FAD-binding domain-containing protein [Pseudomonadota bacterium]
MTTDTCFSPYRTDALGRLAKFLPYAGAQYARKRNYDYGAGLHNSVSTLSPYIRHRILTEHEVLTSTLQRHSVSAAEKFIQEVFWRTYWKGWLELRPEVWTQYQLGLRHQIDAIHTQSGLRENWTRACSGDTGIDCFDAWAKELCATGYLHNHARMWFASIWIFTLQLPWELGADFFMRHLLDGDPASNTLSWRWVGGVQTPGKTYLARPDNIATYTNGRFQRVSGLASTAAPRHAQPPAQPRNLPRLPDIDPTLKTGFLLHAEDLSPGFVLDQCPSLAAVAMIRADENLTPLHLSERVLAFKDQALLEAANRYDLGELEHLETPAKIVDWANKTDLEQIVTAYAPVGPIARVQKHLRKSDAVRVVQVRRDYDSRAWPHATHGFFRFKNKIPDLLNAL